MRLSNFAGDAERALISPPIWVRTIFWTASEYLGNTLKILGYMGNERRKARLLDNICKRLLIKKVVVLAAQ